MMSTCKSSMETILTVSTVYSSFLPFTLYFYYSVIESPLVNALYCVYMMSELEKMARST